MWDFLKFTDIIFSLGPIAHAGALEANW